MLQTVQLINIGVYDDLQSWTADPQSGMLDRHASLSPLDTCLLPVAGVAEAVVGRGADAVGAAAVADRQTPGLRRVRGVHRVAAFALALVQADAVAVQAGRLADRFAHLRRAPGGLCAEAGVEVHHVARLADTLVGSNAPAFRAAVVPAQGRRLDGGSLIGAPASLRVHHQPVVADALVGSDAGPVSPATVPAPVPSRLRRHAPAGVRVQAGSRVADAAVRRHAGPSRAAAVLAQRRGAGLARQGHAGAG